MNYSAFKEEVIKRLKDFYGKDATVSVKEVQKTNGVVLDGISIVLNDDSRIVPVIYLNSFFESFSEGERDLEDVVGEIVDLREKSDSPAFDGEEIYSLTDWLTVRNRIFPMLVSTKANDELLQRCINRSFLDLSIIYTIRLHLDNSGIGTVKITKELFDSYGITEQELHDQAIKNMKEQEQYTLQDISEVILSMLPGSEEATPDLGQDMPKKQMFVLSNSCKQFGAAGVLDRRLLRSLNCDLFIIPSSIHETIVVPAEEGMRETDFDAMIRDVNSTQVEAQEILSDHVYFYNFNTDQIQMRVAVA